MLAILSPVSAALLALSLQPTVRQVTWTWCDDVVETNDNPFTIDDYTRLVDDEVRTAGFRMAIERRLRHRPESVVLDIGTGPFALLALFAAQSGARKVYAVEASATAAEQARATVAAAEEGGAIPRGSRESRLTRTRTPTPTPTLTPTPSLTLTLTLTPTLTPALTIRDVEEHRDEAGAAEQVGPHVDRLVVELRRDAGRRVIRHQGSRSGQAGSRTWNSDLTHERRSWFAL